MALEFICAVDVMKGKRIIIPKGANCFRTKSGKVNFYQGNLFINEKTFKIPKKAREMSFEEFEEHTYHIVYGNPVFYTENKK